MYPLRIGVLGCGSIGRRHAHNLRHLGVERLSLYDAIRQRAARLASEIQGEIAASLSDFWGRPLDAVVIAAPTPLHFELARGAVNRGLSLFIEKPLSHALDGIASLEMEVATKGLVTMVGCNMRFHPGPAAVKRLLDEGTVGNLLALRFHVGAYLPDWQPGRDYRTSYSADPDSGGIILDAIHEIDLALWMGGPARVVGAAGRRATPLGLDNDGLCEMLLRHRSGTLTSLHMNYLQRDYRRTCHAIGNEGTLYWDFAQPKVARFGPDGQETPPVELPRPYDPNAMYLEEMNNFLTCVLDGRPTVNPLNGGREALEVAIQARRWPGLFEGD